MNILVIEDEPDIMELIRFHLEREGFRVIRAQNGDEGLSVVRDEMPRLVLLDLLLPGLTASKFAGGSSRIPRRNPSR